MFTVDQIEQAHSKVKSGADFSEIHTGNQTNGCGGF